MDFLKDFILKNKKILLLLALFAVILFPLLANNNYYIHIGTLVFLYCILSLGLNLVVGYAGLLNLGYSAFYGIGAYAAALLMTKLGLSFWICLPLIALITAAAGLLLGSPALRLRGDYLAIVTLCFGEIFRITANNWDSLTNGPRGITGIPKPVLGSFVFKESIHFYYLALALALFTLISQVRLNNSRIGRAWIAIREDEVAAELMGVNTLSLKLLVFALSSAFAGIAGCFFASWQGFVSPDSFTFMESVTILSMVILGGMGSLVGVVFGTTFLVILPEMLRCFAEWRTLFLGAAMVLVMLFRPQGLMGNWRRAQEMKPETEREQQEEDEALFETRRK